MAQGELIGGYVSAKTKRAMMAEAAKRGTSVSSLLNDLLITYLEAAGHEFDGSPRPFFPGAGVVIIGVGDQWSQAVSIRKAGLPAIYSAIMPVDGTMPNPEGI